MTGEATGTHLVRESKPRSFSPTHAGCIKFVLRLTPSDGQEVVLTKVLDSHLGKRETVSKYSCGRIHSILSHHCDTRNPLDH